MSVYGALRGLSYLARDVWGAVLNASQPRSRTGFTEHYAALMAQAGRQAGSDFAAKPISFNSLRDIPRATPRPVLTAVPIRDYEADDEAQTDCGLGGVYVAPQLDIAYGDGRDKLASFVGNDGVLRTEKLTDSEFQDVMFNRTPVTRPGPVQRAADLAADAWALVDRLTSAAPAPDTDAAADAPPPDFPPRRGAPTSTVVDPFTWAAVDGPAPSNPLPGAGPLQLTSGDFRAGALAAREKAKTCDPADAPGWAALGHRLIQAAHAMTLRAAMNDTNPENVEVDGYDR